MIDSASLTQRVAAFIDDPKSEDFNGLACAAATWQAERTPALRRLWQESGLQRFDDWRRIPALPTLAFKNTKAFQDVEPLFSSEDPEPESIEFRSSGTTGKQSLHRHSFLDLYRQTVRSAFPAVLPAGFPRLPMLSLIPDRRQAPHSSLAFMIEQVVAEFGDQRSAYAWSDRGLDAQVLRSWLATSQRSPLPVMVLTTTLSLDRALTRLERFGLRLRLPPGSRVLHTGGAKTESGTVDLGGLGERVQTYLGLPAECLVAEYGMTELTSQLYALPNSGSESASPIYRPPHWVRVRVLDPATLNEMVEGDPGLISVLDLANLSSSLHILTQDLGVAVDGGVRLEGRAGEAELRGCSLLTESLSESVVSGQ